jgi:hypothetical protein
MQPGETGMSSITRRWCLERAGDAALGLCVASSPLLSGCREPAPVATVRTRATAAIPVSAQPTIIGTQTFVDSTSAKTTDYAFNATVPPDCTLVVMLYGIGPVSQAATGLTNVRLGSSTMTEHPELAPNSWAISRPGVGGYYLIGPPTGLQTLLATPEAATHAVSIHLIYLTGFAADPIGAGDNFDDNTNVTARSTSIPTEADDSYILAMIAVRNSASGLALSDSFTQLIAPGASGGTTFDDHTYIVGYKQATMEQAYTYGATWTSPSTRAGCGAIELKLPVSSPPPPSPSSLPEDEPLPPDSAILNANPSNFASVYNSAAAGNHIVLANGSYGPTTLGRSFPTGQRLVIRAQNRFGATFGTLLISGSGQIVSGVDVTATQIAAVGIRGSNVRFTRGRVTGGGFSFAFGPGITDALVDHCESRKSQRRMFINDDPKDQKRITVARCWCHDLDQGPFTPSFGSSNLFNWQDENIYRERDPRIIVRFCYVGPGNVPGIDFSDFIHHKGTGAIYAFSRFDGGVPCHFRFGMRNRMVGCYIPGASTNVWDDGHWLFGNVLGHLRLPAGISAYYDTEKSLITGNQGGFPAPTRFRMSGCQVDRTTLGIDLSNNNFCERTDGALPDAQPAGYAKPARSWMGVNYAAIPVGDGISIRSHLGLVETDTGMTCLNPQAVNVSFLPTSAAPASWLSELLAEYPWIGSICPNPTSLTGGPGGSRPWSIAQGLTRGDAATPNTGPFRDSPGGLP